MSKRTHSENSNTSSATDDENPEAKKVATFVRQLVSRAPRVFADFKTKCRALPHAIALECIEYTGSQKLYSIRSGTSIEALALSDVAGRFTNAMDRRFFPFRRSCRVDGHFLDSFSTQRLNNSDLAVLRFVLTDVRVLELTTWADIERDRNILIEFFAACHRNKLLLKLNRIICSVQCGPINEWLPSFLLTYVREVQLHGGDPDTVRRTAESLALLPSLSSLIVRSDDQGDFIWSNFPELTLTNLRRVAADKSVASHLSKLTSVKQISFRELFDQGIEEFCNVLNGTKASESIDLNMEIFVSSLRLSHIPMQCKGPLLDGCHIDTIVGIETRLKNLSKLHLGQHVTIESNDPTYSQWRCLTNLENLDDLRIEPRDWQEFEELGQVVGGFLARNQLRRLPSQLPHSQTSPMLGTKFLK